MGAVLATMPFFAACSDEENEVIDPDPETPTLEDQWKNADTVTWPADTVVNLTDHYTVPAGKTLFL